MSGYEGETRRLGKPGLAKWEYATYRCYVTDIDPGIFREHLDFVIEIEGTEYQLDDGLNILGEDGWELVAVQQVSERGNVGGYLNYRHIFKRPLD